MLECLNKKKPPYILICEDMEENLFGVFFTERIEAQKGAFGTRTTFVFKILKCSDSGKENESKSVSEIGEHEKSSGNINVITYRATGNTPYFCMCNSEFLAFGCSDGRFGLLFSGDLLAGDSYPVQTFENECLAGKNRFRIKTLEAWSMTL
jgi:hypothetical protein